MLPLKSETGSEWVDTVLANFNAFLQDHAQCERKAMATAMSLVSRYPSKEALVEPMICLAKEELAHFHEVYRLMKKNGLDLSTKTQDRYVKSLLTQVRNSESEYFLDRLLVCGLIEARSAERFSILAGELNEEPWKSFYRGLAQSEKGHWRVFYRIANHYFPSEASGRLEQLAVYESECVSKMPALACVH